MRLRPSSSTSSTGWDVTKSEVVTSATLVCRAKATDAVLKDQNVRRALQIAVDNTVVLQLGYNNAGTVAENHHVCPIHPEYAELPKVARDIEKAKAMMTEAGHIDTEFELRTSDQEWQKNTGDAIAAQIREAGIKVKRTVMPATEYNADWDKHPWSTTEWNMRPLGVQVLALAYRSGEAWNESSWSNADFDAKLDQALSVSDADKRREIMKDVQLILQDSGILIQAYWRKLFNHSVAAVKNHGMHPTFEHDFGKVWLRRSLIARPGRGFRRLPVRAHLS